MSDNSGNPALVSANEYDLDSSELSCIESNDINELNEYHSIIKMYRDYPKDVFVPELSCIEASDINELYEYHSLIKMYRDYPKDRS
jgi:hypothetical protein